MSLEDVSRQKTRQIFSSVTTPTLWTQYGMGDPYTYIETPTPPPPPSIRIYDTQHSVTVFQSAWLNEVVRKRCTLHDVPLGQYLVLPHYLVQVESEKNLQIN